MRRYYFHALSVICLGNHWVISSLKVSTKKNTGIFLFSLDIESKKFYDRPIKFWDFL